MDPKQHARHVAIDDGRPFTMDDARDRTSGVPANPRQGDELAGAFGDPATEPCHAGLGCFVQPARAAVVAKPLPHREHLALGGGRKRGRRRPSRDERVEPLDDSTDLRLLQHALADEGAITASLAPPWEVTCMLDEPPFDRGGEPLWCGGTSRRPGLCATLALPTPGVTMVGAAAPPRGSPAD